MIIKMSEFSKGALFKLSSVHTETQSPRFQIPPFEERFNFKKLRFGDRLVWTVGLTVEIKLYFQIPPAYFVLHFLCFVLYC